MFTHNLPFDPTYGYTEDQMRQIIPPEPAADFEAFWRGKYQASLDVPTRIAFSDYPGQVRNDAIVRQIDFDAMGLNGQPPVRIGGWLIEPKNAAPVRLEVNGHGYGGRDAPDQSGANEPVVRLQVCKRGFHRSIQPDLPVNESKRHVVSGIGSRETYVHLGNAADLWAGVKVLSELFPTLVNKLDYAGGSFGGGIGALAMPWDKRVRRVFLDVPSFGNHPLRLLMRCEGSGEAVRQLHQSGQDLMPVLQYFDAAVATRFMDKPTIVGCARFDPAVPPPGQFSVYNAIPSEKKLVPRDGGHWDYPNQARQVADLQRQVREWFDAE